VENHGKNQSGQLMSGPGLEPRTSKIQENCYPIILKHTVTNGSDSFCSCMFSLLLLLVSSPEGFDQETQDVPYNKCVCTVSVHVLQSCPNGKL
jgi:hypothetical protein